MGCFQTAFTVLAPRHGQSMAKMTTSHASGRGWMCCLSATGGLFAEEMSQLLAKAAETDDLAPVEQALREWRVTSETYSDPELATAIRGSADWQTASVYRDPSSRADVASAARGPASITSDYPWQLRDLVVR